MRSRYGENFDEYKKMINYDEFLVKDDYEWLGWNWRKIRVGNRTLNSWTNDQSTRRAAFLEMINEDFMYFPSLKQIFEGI